MKLDFLPIDRLSVSKANMRYAKKAPDVSDILPSIRRRGVIQPIIVRAQCCAAAAATSDPGHYEIIAGSRRFHAEQIAAQERAAALPAGAEAEPAMLPCAILEDGDDADALEASMLENMARLDPDEVTQWESFTRLVKEGRHVDDIATTFGLPELAVRRVLALGNLLPRIRDLYRRAEIDATTVRHLTMASKSQQKAWLTLLDDPDGYAPSGHQLKAWLLGGQSIPASHALFDVETSGLATIADLFGEDRYFTDRDAFWAAQNAAIEARRAAYIEAGWADTVIMSPGDYFSTWEYEKTGKRKGGRVYIAVRATGEVAFHEGYVSRKEAERAARIAAGGEEADSSRPKRPELTSTLATYVDLHRHAAVRTALLGHPQVALRLTAAHMIAGSSLWSVRVEPQTTRNDDVRDSLDNASSEALFDARRRALLALMGLDDDAPTLAGCGGYRGVDPVALFRRLLELPETAVMEVVTLAMGETLSAGSPMIEALGLEIGVDMGKCWTADDAFFGLLRDREVLLRIVADVAGEAVASANAGEKTKALKAVIRDHLEGSNGRAKRENWVPRWMAFPPSAYTARGGVGTVEAHASAVTASLEMGADDHDAPDPDTGEMDGFAIADEEGEADGFAAPSGAADAESGDDDTEDDDADDGTGRLAA